MINNYAIRRYVTLLELLVVISILALVGGIVAIGISKALVDQRFRTEVSMIVDELRLAQDLMIILGTDVHMRVAESPDNKSIEYWLEFETSLPNELQRQLIQQHHRLKTISGFFFRDKLDDAYNEGKVAIKFLSKGMIMSKGILRLATSDQANEANVPKNALQNYICLAGYPRPISSVDTKEAADTLYNSFETPDFDRRLTEDTLNKLPDSLKPKTDAEKQQKKQQSEQNKKKINVPAQGKKPNTSA